MNQPASPPVTPSWSTVASRWTYLLDPLCAEVRGVTHAVVVSTDGLLIARSSDLTKDHADSLSAITSGLASLTFSAANLMSAGPVEQNVTEMRDGFLVVMAIDNRSLLIVLAAKDADMGQVAYEMATLINRVGAAVTPEPRHPQRV